MVFGFLIGILLMHSIPTGNIFIFFSFLLIGALLPDIDQPNSFIVNKIPWLLKPISMLTKHRGIFHSLLAAFLLSALVFYIYKPFGFALFLGYTSHLFIDGFTQQGVNFLHPISKLHLSGFIETGKLLEHVLLVLLITAVLLILF